MKTRINKPLLAALVILSTLSPQLSTLFAQDTAFTYQARLNDGPAPAHGTYDLTFSLFGVSSGGGAVAGPLTNSAVAISNGVFTVVLDFGNAFDGGPRWVEIGTRASGGPAFSTLSPRQLITSAPYAIRSLQVADGAITSQSLADGAVTASKLAPGAVNQLGGADGSPTNAVQVDASGLVGIGTTTPEAGLHIRAGAPLVVPRAQFQVQDGTGPYTNLAGARQVAVQGNLAAITASSDHAVTVVNLADPVSPQFQSQIWDGLGPFTNLAGASGIAWAGSNFLVAAAMDNAVTIVSAVDPTNLVRLAELRDGVGGWNEIDGARSVSVSGNLVAIGAQNDDAVTLGDISNPGAPLLRLVMKNGTFGFNDLDGVSAVALSGNLLAIAAAISDAVTVVDVSNPANPLLLATLKHGVAGYEGLNGAAGVALAGTLLAIAAANSDAVTLVDVSNPASPVKLAELRADSGDFALSGATSLAFSGNRLAVASRFDGAVTLLDVSNPLTPTLLATARPSWVHFLGGASGVAWVGTALSVVADSSSAYSVLEFPIEQAGLITSGWAGIGTTRPVAPLHVSGNVVVENAEVVDLNASRVELGRDTTASGLPSTAMGSHTTASGNFSTAMGYQTTASGTVSTAMGLQTIASGGYSTAMGFLATASGEFSTAMGYAAEALHNGTFVWADASGGRFESTGDGQFLIRAHGGVGINTTVPGSALDVRGDIRFGSSGQFLAPGAVESVRIVRGVVSAAGAILAGQGFTVTRTTVGSYTVTFGSSFMDLPTVTVAPQAGVARMATSTNVGNSGAQFRTFDAAGTLVDAQFHFIAIGPR